MSSGYFVLHPSTTIRFSASDAQEVQIVAGEGSKRVELVTTNNRLRGYL
jgi:urease beta subunit